MPAAPIRAATIRERSSLEQQFEPQLRLPHRCVRGERRDGADRGRSHLRRGLAEVRVVEDVEELSAELQLDLLANPEVLEQREVEILETGSADGVASRVPETE